MDGEDDRGSLGHQVGIGCLVEFREHEVVARAGPCENGEMDLKPEQVNEEGRMINPTARATKYSGRLPLSSGGSFLRW